MKKLRVLLVDDENRLREVLERAVGSWGFLVAGARTGIEAMRLMEAMPFDIAILDLNLPGISGIELFEKLRRIYPRLQVIILSGFGDLESAKAAIRLDVADFLTKPCHLGELEQSLHRASQRMTKEAPAEKTHPVENKTSDPANTLEEIERKHILAALERNQGNRTATAIELGISRRTLQYKIIEYQRQGFAVD
jgi:DNA-binding NtrC family response regulator